MKTPLVGVAAFFACVAASPIASAQIDTVQTLAPGVYFHQGDPRSGHSNNGWVVLDDFVIVVEANFPSGAKVVMPKVRATSDKPVRFVFNTHHHGDHAYGNQLWADAGATILATERSLQEMKTVETGFFGGAPGRWEAAAAKRADVAASRLKPPVLLFGDELFFDDGKRRVELRYFGVAHTKGDGFLWLPAERILFTGDACVNGPHINMNDGDTGEWIKTLEKLKSLDVEKVCPGHGPLGGPEIIADQQRYFVELRRELQALRDANKSPAEVKAALPEVAARLKKIPNIARYVPASLNAHGEKVFRELGGGAFPK